MYLNFIILLLQLLNYSENSSQESYYYFGKRIELKKRYDKITVITNSDDKVDSYLSLKKIVSPKHSLIKVQNNIYIIDLKENSKPEADYYSNILSYNKSLIKFTANAYYGESRKVSQMVSDEFIVKLKNLKDTVNLHILNKVNNIFVKEFIVDKKVFILKTNNGNPKNSLELSSVYYNSRLLEYAEPNFIYTDIFLSDPNDTYFSSQWSLKNTGQIYYTGGNSSYGDATTSHGIPFADINFVKAWNVVSGNNLVTIATLDTGVDSLQVDLSQNLIAGYNPTNNTNSVKTDTWGHGTNTIGILGGVSNNGIGVAGIAGGNGTAGSSCRIMNFKLIDDSGHWTTDEIISKAFDTARVRGIHVLSNSWGGGNPVNFLTDAINLCADSSRDRKGTVICFASGNDGSSPPAYPGRLPKVICVGASTPTDQKKAPGTGNEYDWGGNFGQNSDGEDLDIVAPTCVVTTAANSGHNSYEILNGTSAACPHVAGVAGLIFSINPDFTAEQVKEYLLRGADKIDNLDYSTSKTYGKWNPYTGYGRLNAYNSVKLAQGADVTPPTINHLNIASDSSTYPHLVSAEIIDQDGSAVPSTGQHIPKIFYRFNKNNSGWTNFDSSNFSSNTSNTFNFYIPGVGKGTQIQYYIYASDATGNETTFPLHPNINYPYTLCYFAVGDIVTESANISNWTVANGTSYGANSQVSGSLPFGNFQILDVKVKVSLSQPDISASTLILWSPNSDVDNNRKCLLAVNGASGSNIDGAFVSDSGIVNWNGGVSPYSDALIKPDYVLRGLNGTNASGNWKFIAMNYDLTNSAIYSNLTIYLKHLNSTTSPSIRHNQSADTLVSFVNVISTTDSTINFYVKNDGNANLDISSYNIQGTFASKFSILNTPPSSINSNDSGLFKIRFYNNAVLKNDKSGFEGAVLQIYNNDPSKSIFRVSLQSDSPLPVELISFNSEISGRLSKLLWETSIEQNNSGFEIQRFSKNNNIWQSIGFAKGKNIPSKYIFEDDKLQSGVYQYRIKQVDFNGNFHIFNLKNEVKIGIPERYFLSQNYPNPFNPSTKIDFELPVNTIVNITLYDITGKKILTILNQYFDAGFYTQAINSETLSSGLYFIRISAGNWTKNIKALLLK